jgi:uncharacterized protein YcsI (UPF0317 family)
MKLCALWDSAGDAVDHWSAVCCAFSIGTSLENNNSLIATEGVFRFFNTGRYQELGVGF